MKNNSMTNLAFVSTRFNPASNTDADTFNIGTQAAVLDSDPYQFLDTLDKRITRSPMQTEARVSLSRPLSLN